MRLGLSLVAGLVFLLEGSQPAVACTPLTGVLEFAPSDGTRLPANGRVYALATNYDWPLVNYVQDDISYQVEASIRRARRSTIVTPLSDASPGQVSLSYGLRLLQPPFPDGELATRVVLDEAEDHTPPGDFAVEWLSSVGPKNHGWCFGEYGRIATLSIERPTDDWGVLYFDFYDEAGLHIGSAAADSRNTRQVQVELPSGRDCVTVTAVDFGGNRTSTQPVCHAGCRCFGAVGKRGVSASSGLVLAFALLVIRRRSPGREPTK